MLKLEVAILVCSLGFPTGVENTGHEFNRNKHSSGSSIAEGMKSQISRIQNRRGNIEELEVRLLMSQEQI